MASAYNKKQKEANIAKAKEWLTKKGFHKVKSWSVTFEDGVKKKEQTIKVIPTSRHPQDVKKLFGLNFSELEELLKELNISTQPKSNRAVRRKMLSNRYINKLKEEERLKKNKAKRTEEERLAALED